MAGVVTGRGSRGNLAEIIVPRTLYRDSPVRLSAKSLLPADSPRLDGENIDHVRTLAQLDGPLPPIVVHRPSMRVIDGMHRLRAAELRHESEIDALLIDGDEEQAFILSVRVNIAHGLPLTLADRMAAATRIMSSHPQWSDRAIAAVTGLSHKTVATVRPCASGEGSQLHTRRGRDGRVRPLNSGFGRLLAAEFIKSNPGASLREVASAAGISPGTVRDVRNRVRQGKDPVPAGSHRKVRRPAASRRAGGDVPRGPGGDPAKEIAHTLRHLKRDPSIRFTESGRELLRLFDLHTMDPGRWTRLVDAVPSHCAFVVIDLARRCAAAWAEVADRLERRVAVG